MESNKNKIIANASNVPTSKPKIKRKDLEDKIIQFFPEYSRFDFKKYGFLIVGVRSYYEDTMGVPNKNDIGIYDDAIFLISEKEFYPFNGNTDPSKQRSRMANLVEGFYYSHCFGIHKTYPAIIQLKGKVSLKRYDGLDKDGKEKFITDSGYFGINIHKGSLNSTSSEGCQTIHPLQWDEFISTANKLSVSRSQTIPYILINFS